MDLDQVFATDDKKMSDGVWFALYRDMLVREDLPEQELDNPPARLLIASSDSPKAEAELRKWQRQFRGAISAGGDVAADALVEITCKVIAHALVRDWRNVTSQGEELPCTPDEAYATVKKYGRLRFQIERAAAQLEPFRLDEDSTKN